MPKYGLIGYPLTHSFSQKYFTEKFQRENIADSSYENFPIESIGLLKDLIANNSELVGINVTIPYKEQVISLLDEIDSEAHAIGAVNTIKITHYNETPFLKGFNTDVYGFRKPLEKVLKPIIHKKALILGTGGAAKAVAWVFDNLDINYSFVSRSPKTVEDFSYEMLDDAIINDHKVIVNTSPIGMYPNVNEAPHLPYGGISKDHILYDLIYNPEQTMFLKMGEEKKATLLNGLPMLYLQAEKAYEIWTND
jgi:shikimate dehydrogenase